MRIKTYIIKLAAANGCLPADADLCLIHNKKRLPAAKQSRRLFF
jgi:hypothetical protein